MSSSSTSNSSLARSRSLRLPPPSTLKLPSTTPPQPAVPGPSYVALFLTNLRLLDLDLRDDWPGMTARTFSTKDAQQNQKKRIRCVEWALYQLFALWDPEETRSKLQPFFPPQEPLHSLNLRAAIFRCLEQAKKNGVLGRDMVLRKTMLDECKGERLEEVLAVFSNAVLKQVMLEERPDEHQALAQQLAMENFSYRGDKSTLSSLIWVHKASLGSHLRERHETGARFKDFSDLLSLHDRRIARRHEQLKQLIEDSGGHDMPSAREVESLQKKVQNSWSGNEQWMGSILYGDRNTDRLLESSFDKAWRHVESRTISDLEGPRRVGLLEQLERRVKDQQSRLSRWQDFGRTLQKNSLSSAKNKAPLSTEKNFIDMEFNKHQALRIGPDGPAANRPNQHYLQEYTQLIESMMADLEVVDHPNTVANLPRKSPQRQSSTKVSLHSIEEGSLTKDEEWSSASDTEESARALDSSTTSQHAMLRSGTPPAASSNRSSRPSAVQIPTAPSSRMPINNNVFKPQPMIVTVQKARYPSPPRATREPRSPPRTAPSLDTEDDNLADQILNSVSAASPSPKKPRHTLSLAERTRLSMSRASHSKYSDLHDDVDSLADLPHLSKRNSISPTKPSPAAAEPEKAGKLEGLIERTRKSMAGFEAAQKKAQVERRKSLKEAKKRETDSRKNYFPKLEEETGESSAIELIEKEGEDVDYESVFKSRPKIKTSPAVSPTKEICDNEADDG